MTQATPYTRSTSFADDERDNVGGRSSVRTAQVDAEFDSVGESLNQTTENLAILQRDDGVLRDGIVPTSALSAATLKLISSFGGVIRGAWLTATAYAIKDVVTQSGNTYVCAVAHTSGTFATDLAAVKWVLIQIGANPNAASIPFAPTINVTSTSVQAALVEVDNNWRAAVLAAANKLLAAILPGDGAGGVGFSAAIAYATGTVGRWLTDLATAAGSPLIGFLQPTGTGSGLRTAQDKLAERVSVADKLPAGVTPATATKAQAAAALTAALASGAKRVYVSQAYSVTLANASFAIPAGMILDFDGGSLTFDAATTTTNGLLYASAANVKILDPVIDCTAVAVAPTAINLQNAPGSKIRDPILTKCNINLQSSNVATRMGYQVIGGSVNGAAGQTCIYTSAVKGALIMGVEMFGAKEGLGIYNGASLVREIGCESYGHTQDGSVIINGSKIVQLGNLHHDCGQSGFTTQRQTAGTNCQDVSMVGNLASGNTNDGLDIRGHADGGLWGVDMRLTAVGNVLSGNLGTGAYLPFTEGVVLVGNVTGGNALQGFFANGSPRVSVLGHFSGSNSSGVGAGTSKAGLLFQDSSNGGAIGCIASNSGGATQSYGLSFTGTSVDCWGVGGYYLNNSTAPIQLSANNAYIVGCANNSVGNVWSNTITANSGASDETGFGVPAHTRTKGSIFRRTDGASGEVYVSNGAGSWTGVTIP